VNAKRHKRLQALKDELQVIRDEEQEAHDNLPEGIQESARGETMQDNVDAIDNAIEELNTI
jgi:hypothetical protein